MNRRYFLRRLVEGLMLGWLGTFLASCGGEESEFDLGKGRQFPTSGTNGSLTLTSSQANGHTHQLFFQCGNINLNRTFSLQTTAGGGHVHFVTLNTSHLASLRAGSRVVVASSSSGGHVHQFEIIPC